MKLKRIHFPKETTPSLTGRVRGGSLLFLLLLFLVSCSKDDSSEYDPYYDWQSRNDAWFYGIADQARSAINAAKKEYGEDWTDHCTWRMYKSLMWSPYYQSGQVTDSICMRLLNPEATGKGTTYPISTDVVSVAFQGYLIPTTDAFGNSFETMFTNTYSGTFDPETATFNKAAVSVYRNGFYTALHYMVTGDSWEVYIPYQLFYNESAQGNIPAYSSVRFIIHRKE